MSNRLPKPSRSLPGLLAIASLASSAGADVIIVDAGGRGDFTALPPAVAAARDGDTIIVMSGVYHAGFIAQGKSLTVRSSRPTDPPTIAATILQHAGIELYNVPTFAIQGLTIRDSSIGDGAAILAENSTLHLSHCTLQNNRTPDGYGGAIYYITSTFTHHANRFVNNSAALRGSAVYAVDSIGTVVGDQYVNNWTNSSSSWHSFYAVGGRLAVTNAYFRGEGMRAGDMAAFSVRESTFRFGEVGSPLEYLLHSSSTPSLILNNSFIGNGGDLGGFGDGGDGGAIIVGNTVCGFLIGITVNHGPNVLRDNLIFDNKDGVIWTAWPGSSVDAQYNLFSNLNLDLYQYAVGRFYGTNNFFQIDPGVTQRGIWDTRGTMTPYDDIYTPGDIHLTRNSPCINAGDPNWTFDVNARDLDGQMRVAAGRADIGVDEYPAIGDLDGDGNLTNFDIDAIVLALTDPAAHSAAYPLADAALAGDCNADGRFDNFDIDAFVDCLLMGGCQ